MEIPRIKVEEEYESAKQQFAAVDEAFQAVKDRLIKIRRIKYDLKTSGDTESLAQLEVEREAAVLRFQQLSEHKRHLRLAIGVYEIEQDAKNSPVVLKRIL